MREKISANQFYTLVIVYIISSDIIRGIYARELKADVWIPLIFGTIISILLFTFFIFIYKNNQFDSFDNSVKHSLGKVISKIIYIIYIPYFLSIAYFTIVDVTEVVQIHLLPGYSLSLLTLISLIVVGYLLFKQLEVVARVSNILFVIIIMIFISMLVLTSTIHDFNFNNILPILIDGVKPVIKPALQMGYAIPFGELFVFSIIYQHVDKNEEKTKIGNYAILTASFILISVTFLNIFVLGPHAMTIGTAPAFRIARAIDVEEYIQRLDLLLISFHLLLMFTKTFVLLYGAGEMLKGIVQMDCKKLNIAYIVMLVIVFFAVIYISKDYTKILLFRKNVLFTYICVIAEILLPLIIVIGSFIRRNKKKIKPEEILDYAI